MRYTEFTPYDLVLLAQGLSVTLGLFIATSLIGILLGVIFATVRYYQVTFVHRLLHLLTELLKNSPVLVQLFIVFFGIPAFFQVDVTPTWAAILTISLNTAAFSYVIFRSAIESIDNQQLAAARVFGLSKAQILWHIIAPQAAAFSIAPLVGLLVNQLQVTSLISVIGVFDLTKIGNILNLRTLQPFIVWTAIGLLYYLSAKGLTLLGNRVENRLRASAVWSGL